MFATMIEVPFAVFGEAATYRAPASGSPELALRVIRREEPRDGLLGSAGIRVATATVADVQVTDLAQPEEGASLSVGDDDYTVRAFDRDGERLVWRLDLDPA